MIVIHYVRFTDLNFLTLSLLFQLVPAYPCRLSSESSKVVLFQGLYDIDTFSDSLDH